MKQTIRRRFKTVPAVVLGWFLMVGLLPLLLSAAAAVDLVRLLIRRTPMVGIRLILFGPAYLTLEVVGMLALGLSWLVTQRSKERRLDQAYAIQQWWAGGVFAAVKRLFGLKVTAKNHETAPTPMVLVARHASIVDNLLPAVLLSRPRSIRVRYVMKQELLLDPCLDIAGHRLPNHFLDRKAGASEEELAGLRSLAEGLSGSEALLIYPEGTRFSAVKRRRSLERLGDGGRLAEQAGRLRSVMPPKPGGLHTILDATPAPVVIMAHRGLEGFGTVGDIWRGAMVGTTVEVEFWTYPRSEIPESRADQAAWLYETWQRVDDWVTASSVTGG